jgi:hypothetical protein
LTILLPRSNIITLLILAKGDLTMGINYGPSNISNFKQGTSQFKEDLENSLNPNRSCYPKINYSQSFISEVKIMYPNRTDLHHFLEAGNPFGGYLLITLYNKELQTVHEKEIIIIKLKNIIEELVNLFHATREKNESEYPAFMAQLIHLLEKSCKEFLF